MVIVKFKLLHVEQRSVLEMREISTMEKVVRMTLSFIKSKLQNALIRFGYGILVASLSSLLVVIFQDSFWILGFTVSILLFGVVGAIVNVRSMMQLTALEKESVTIDKDAYVNNIASSMIGSIGLNWIFFTLIILLYAIVYVSLIFFKVPVFQSRLPLSISVGLLVLLVFIEYKIIHQLSFSLLYICFVYSFVDKKQIADKTEDVQAQIKSLIIKYYGIKEAEGGSSIDTDKIIEDLKKIL